MTGRLARTLTGLSAPVLAFLLGWGVLEARSRVLPGLESYGSSFSYAECGEALIHGVELGTYPSFYMPLAGLTAARLFGGAEHWPWREAALLAGLLCVASVCILAGAPLAAVPAVLLVLVWPGLWPGHPAYVQFFYAILVLQAAAAMVWRAASPSPARTAVLAAALGVSLLFRSPLAFLPPLLACLEWASRRERGRTWAVNALILLTVPYLPLLPWAAMNWIVHRRVTLFEQGESFANIVMAAGGLVDYSEEFWRSQARAHPEMRIQGLLGFLQWGFLEVARHPLRYAAGFAGRLVNAVRLQPALFALAAAGAWAHRRSPSARALAAFCAYFLLIHCALVVIADYMVPLWPLLAVLGALLVSPRKGTPESPRLAAAARAWLLFMLACTCLAGAEAEALVLRYARLSGKRAPGSEQAWAEALARDPGNAWLLYRRGWRRLKAGDRSGTAEDWSRASRLRPQNTLWSLHRDWAKHLAGDSKPLLAWNEALSPHTVPSHRADPDLLKAHAHAREDRKRPARAHLLAAYAAVRSRPNPGDEALSLEILWERAGELFGELPPKDWIGLWSELHRLRDDAASRKAAERADPMREAALRLQAAGAHREAAALLDELLRLRPGSPSLRTDKAVAETFKGSWEAAASELKKAIAADEAYLPAYLTLGAVYIKLGRDGEALKVYDRALSLESASGDPLRAVLSAARAETARAKVPRQE